MRTANACTQDPSFPEWEHPVSGGESNHRESNKHLRTNTGRSHLDLPMEVTSSSIFPHLLFPHPGAAATSVTVTK